MRPALLVLGLFGATLFYGDGVITPAISVLGAMEGLEIAAPVLKPYVVPASLAVLVLAVQRFGTAAVGKVFGPIISLWFLTLAVIGIAHIARQPAILSALNPLHAWHFVAERGWHLFAAIGAIVLAITGAEAFHHNRDQAGASSGMTRMIATVVPRFSVVSGMPFLQDQTSPALTRSSLPVP